MFARLRVETGLRRAGQGISIYKGTTVMSDVIGFVKERLGRLAVEHYVKSDMIIGLGTGSTAEHVVRHLGAKLKAGEIHSIYGVPTSEATRLLMMEEGIPELSLEQVVSKMKSLSTVRPIDVAIDGADAIDVKSLTLIKGKGGSLLREKLVEQLAQKFVVVADETKVIRDVTTRGLGMDGLPIDVCTFGRAITEHVIKERLMRIGYVVDIYHMKVDKKVAKTPPENEMFVTDDQHNVIQIYFRNRPISNAKEMTDTLLAMPGVVEHGLFVGMATEAFIGYTNGSFTKIEEKPVGSFTETSEFPYFPL